MSFNITLARHWKNPALAKMRYQLASVAKQIQHVPTYAEKKRSTFILSLFLAGGDRTYEGLF